MNVSALSGGLSVQSTSSVSSSVPAEQAGSVVGDAATSNVSTAGSIFDQLESLEQSDPAKFKQVVGEMASALREDAKQATGADATMLGKMADRLDQAAHTGQLADASSPSGAQPARHHGHGHHHHGGGAGAIGVQLQSAFAAAMSSAGGSTSTTATTTTTATTADTTAGAVPTTTLG
jgi:hypothetical protein